MRIVLAAAAVLALAGCEERDPREAAVPEHKAPERPRDPGVPPPVTVNPYRGEAGMDPFTWFSSRSNDGRSYPILMYGGPGGSEIAINLQCPRPGAITVIRGADSYASAQEEIVLRSDQTVASLTLKGADPPNGQSEFFGRADLPLDAPLLKAFGETGLLTVSGQGEARQMDAIDEAEKATIRAFLADCRARSG